MICYKCTTPMETDTFVARINPELVEVPGPKAYCPTCQVGQLDWYYYQLIKGE